MKRLMKALSFALLLALVVSSFAVFGAFAAESTGAASDTGRVVLYELGASGAPIVSNATTGKDGWSKVTADDGSTYWRLDTDPTNTQDFTMMEVSLPGANYANSVVAQDVYKYTGTGTADDPYVFDTDNPKYKKNTDYMVVDFDISTDTILAGNLYFHTVFQSDKLSDSSSSRIQDARTYVELGDVGGGKIGVGTNNNHKLTIKSLIDSDEKWTDITVVYDFSGDNGPTAAGVAGDWKGYVYINGYYCGTVSAAFFRSLYGGELNFSTGKVFSHFRLGTTYSNNDDAATNIANFTISKFEAGYDGRLSEAGVLGTATSLRYIPELAYCLENNLNDTVEYEKAKIADVQRGTETISVYDVDDLHGDLLDGDVVTVYADVAALKPAYVIQKIYDEALATDVEPTVVWQDANGVVLGEEGSLYAAPKIVYAKSDSDWIITKDGAFVFEGKNNSIAVKNSAGEWVIYDPLYQARYSADTGEILLLDDYVAYGVGKSKTIDEGDTTFSDAGVTPTTTTATSNRYSKNFVMDLNGHVFTNSTIVNHWAVGYGGSIIFKNGEIRHGSAKNVLMMSNAQSYAIFDNCTITVTGKSVVMDHRYGTVVIRNSIANSTTSLDNVKAVGTGSSYVLIENSTINSTTKGDTDANGIIHASQVSSSGQRQGGGNIYLSIVNSTVTSDETVFYTDTYANGLAHTGENYVKNEVDYVVEIVGSSVTSYGALASTSVAALPGTATTSEGMLDVSLDLDIKSSTVESFVLLIPNSGTNDTSLVKMVCDIDLVDSGLKLRRLEASGKYTVGGLTQQNYTLPEVNVHRGIGCMFSTANEARGNDTATYTAPNVTMDEGCQLAYTAANGYIFIVTDSTETYSYQLGNLAPVEFVWNKAEDGSDMPVMSKVVSVKDAPGVYKYSWANDGKLYYTVLERDFNVSAKANLSLYTDISLNLYINAEEYDATRAYTVKGTYGNVITPELVVIDGVNYYKFAGSSVAPVAVEDDSIVLEIVVGGAYGDAIVERVGYAVSDYLLAYTPSGDEDLDHLFDMLVNYVRASYDYAGLDKSIFDSVGTDSGYSIGAWGQEIGTLSGVDVAVMFAENLSWGLRAEPGTVLTVEYSRLGVKVERTLTVGESGVVYLTVDAADFLDGITVKSGTESATVTLEAYYEALTDEGAKAVVEAIYNYADAMAKCRVIETVAAAPESGERSSDTLVFRNKRFDSASVGFIVSGFGEAKHVVFENCVFTGSGVVYVGGTMADGVESVTFRGCIFTVADYALGLVGNDVSAPDYLIENCYFNSDRGINISGNCSGTHNSFVYGNIVIRDNVFVNKLADKPAIQLAGDVSGAAALTVESISILGNEFRSGTALRAHESLSADAASIEITITGNTVGEGVLTAVGDGTETSDAIAAVWAAKFN